MSDATTQGTIQFIQNYQTALDAGEYEIAVTQTIQIKINDAPSLSENDTFNSKLKFAICGNRFGLQPQDIHAVFPPENSLGDHAHVLPHIALKSSTLPWERLVHPDAPQEIPWLALLLLHDDEKLLRTIQREDFLNAKFFDQQGKEITEDTKKSLWQHLLNDSGWLNSTKTDSEVIIVEKEARKVQNLSGDFAVFDSQVEALLTQSRSIKTLTLKQLEASSEGTIKWPAVTLEVGQHEKDRVSVIDVPHSLLSKILPTSQDMGYLAHVRQTTGGTESSEPLAVVVSNRLPKQGGASVAYLVSLENRCFIKALEEKDRKKESLSKDAEGNNFEGVNDEIKKFLNSKVNTKVKKEELENLPAVQELEKKIKAALWNYLLSPEIYWLEAVFDDQDTTDQHYIRLVALKSWSFSCSDPEQSFKGLLKRLNVGTLQLPKRNREESDASKANAYLAQGYVPFRHYLRQGGNTFSWYHSPLLPGKNTTNLGLSQFAVRCADQLIAYDENNGLFDISYAAAWQLGQLLALQDKKLAINLFNWKRANAQKLAKDNQQALYSHLFPTDSPNTGDSLSLPEDIATWFNQLALLAGVPFNYLVPDDKMLPPESISFFWLDWFWVESLLDGAFSIGRVHESSPKSDTLPKEVKQITGCLIRSEVIAGWPDLQVDASTDHIPEDQPMQEDQKLGLLRRDRLSQDVLICLFEGEIQTLDISLKPEGLHFGFNSKGDQLHRELRKLNGTEQNDCQISPLHWKDANQRIVNIDQLAEAIQQTLKEKGEKFDSFTSAQFALQMVQGAELVRFLRSST